MVLARQRRVQKFAVLHSFVIAIASLLLVFSNSSPAFAEAEVQEGKYNKSLKLFTYEWKPVDTKVRGIVIAIHGWGMHGRTYDSIASTLADDGFHVIALDLRGYGKWRNCSACTKEKKVIDYQGSLKDLDKLVEAVKKDYPGDPIYLMGESMGADIALRYANDNHQNISGLILSSPALAIQTNFKPKMIFDMARFWTLPDTTIDMTDYMQSYASEDPRIINEDLNDPLIMKKMKVRDLRKCRNFIKGTMESVENIPSHIPILIMQGNSDRVCKIDKVLELAQDLKSDDETIRWFVNKGHLLLETSYVQPETIQTVSFWLNQRSNNSEGLQASRDSGFSTFEKQ